MKIEINNLKSVQRHLKQNVDEIAKNTLNKFVDYTTNLTQNNFDRFVYEVASDDPFVFVYNTPLVKTSKTTYTRHIDCIGNQVLFIEFGAGVYYGQKEVDIEGRFFNSMPIPQRPKGIDDIGSYHLAKYGRSQGKEDYWFYKSQTGRESENAHFVKNNKNGDSIMITHGNRPARALYRSLMYALRKLRRHSFK